MVLQRLLWRKVEKVPVEKLPGEKVPGEKVPVHCTHCIATMVLQRLLYNECIATPTLQHVHCTYCNAPSAFQRLHCNACIANLQHMHCTYCIVTFVLYILHSNDSKHCIARSVLQLLHVPKYIVTIALQRVHLEDSILTSVLQRFHLQCVHCKSCIVTSVSPLCPRGLWTRVGWNHPKGYGGTTHGSTEDGLMAHCCMQGWALCELVEAV